MAKQKKNRAARRENREFTLATVRPKSARQVSAFGSTRNLVMCGSAGTGKSFLSCYFAFDGLADGVYNDVVIIRSAVPTRDMGFMPGNDKEKAAVYEEPYKAICTELYNRGDAYEILKKRELVKFMTTSYIRGLTLKYSCVIVDECQNMTFHELDSLITRIGEGCRLILSGDFKQTDLRKNGLKDFLEIIKEVPDAFDIIEFTPEDIQRSDLVRDYLIAKERLGKLGT
jgi:phosphate starvation-inducible PhoH-like protein